MKLPTFPWREKDRSLAQKAAQDQAEKLLVESFRTLSSMCTKLADFIETQRLQRQGYDEQGKFLERLGDAQYGYGWRSYEYAGHHIIGHRGGVNGYRSLILFDPQLKSGVVALWNSNTSQPGGLEFEVMDMLYGLDFRDWMELDKGGATATAAAGEEPNSGDARN